MSGIHDAILNKLQSELEANLITNIDPADPARAGVVMLGPLQGDPDPDVARISVTLHENDPDAFISGAVTGLSGNWSDEVAFTEVGGGKAKTTWKRRFTCKARCLLEQTGEELASARDVASVVRDRIEETLSSIDFNGIVASDGEYVSRGVASDELVGEMLQGGGPPSSYDFMIKYRFSVLTTE